MNKLNFIKIFGFFVIMVGYVDSSSVDMYRTRHGQICNSSYVYKGVTYKDRLCVNDGMPGAWCYTINGSWDQCLTIAEN